MKYTAKDISEITNSRLVGDPNLEIEHLAFDTRNIYSSKNTAFIAINTRQNSGEGYISSAIEKGIKLIISKNKVNEREGITWILVDDPIRMLQKLAQHHFNRYSLKSIGITGSNGKTIVKEWLYQCLWNETRTVKSPKSFNSQIGLPLSLLQIDETHEMGIFEVGISKPEEMSILEEIFSPNIGILTHIGTAHSVNFSSEEELIDEKIKLFKGSDTIIFNGDNDQVYTKIRACYSSKKLISYGFKARNEVSIINDWMNQGEDLRIKYFEEELVLPVEKRHEAILMNALAVISTLKVLGFENEKIIEKINALQSVEMRLESVNGLRNNLIINDSFNLDLDSLKIALQFITQYKKEQKTIILTDIIDVKEPPESLYRQVADQINAQYFSEVFLIGSEITKYQNDFTAPTFCFNSTEEFIDSQKINTLENRLILLKGARKFGVEKIKYQLELQKHDTVLEINLNAILHNLNIHKSFLKPSTKMMAMVKAFSYGLGSYEIAEFLQYHHIDYLGVAFADEGIELRKNGITTPIMVMNPEQNTYDSIIEYKLEPEIYNFRVLKLFNQQLLLKGSQERYPIHLKIETGMHRLGFKEEEIEDLIEQLRHYNVKVMSVFSHLSSSDDLNEKDYTLEQIRLFEKITKRIVSALGYQPILHILNSSGIINYPNYQFDMVRIGIGMMGVSSNPQIKALLQSAVSFKTLISQVSVLKKGESLGYNRSYIAKKDIRIATLPVGYADGIPRFIGNQRGFVGINKTLVPIIGNVCMDMLMVDLGDLNAKEGDEVLIFNSTPSLEDFSMYCKTIPYEVLTSISRRVKRIYIKD